MKILTGVLERTLVQAAYSLSQSQLAVVCMSHVCPHERLVHMWYICASIDKQVPYLHETVHDHEPTLS